MVFSSCIALVSVHGQDQSGFLEVRGLNHYSRFEEIEDRLRTKSLTDLYSRYVRVSSPDKTYISRKAHIYTVKA